MACVDKPDSSCPFAFTDQSELAQNYGCLPAPFDIVYMRQHLGKTWACHEQPDTPCVGAIRHMKEHQLEHTVIDKKLVTEESWNTLDLK